MDVFHPFDLRCDVSFRLMACSGHHVSLRSLSLHVCNECQKQKKQKISPSQLLLPAQLQPVTALCPVQVTPWDPSRPWRGPTAQLGSSAQSSNPLFTQGPFWGPHHLSLGVWGWGQQPAHQLVVRQVSQRLRLIKAFGGKHPLATSGRTA